ncbi:MAG: hypothetical protein IKZ72_04455, partial [Bacteroidales bacterium]|nr:hypothetical protein [Bacteroidales bacterium]
MREIEITVPLKEGLQAEDVKRTVEARFPSETCVITRRSIDARGKAVWRYRVEVYGADETYEPYRLPELRDVHGAPEVLVVGAGP